MVHPLEQETINLLKEQGFDFSMYLNPVPYLPSALVGPVSSILEEADEEEPEEDDEE